MLSRASLTPTSAAHRALALRSPLKAFSYTYSFSSSSSASATVKEADTKQLASSNASSSTTATQTQPPTPTKPQTTNSTKEQQHQRVRSVAELDEELRQRLEEMSGDGGASGLEYEDGKAVAMKRGVRSNMFRVI